MTSMMKPTLIVAMTLLACVSAQAQTTAGRHDPPAGPRLDIAKELGITSAKAAEVEAILNAGRERMRAAREQTKAELAQVLTPPEQARLESLLPGPPRGPEGGRPREGAPPR
jgi:Spy/CpxP family protein refolding chaperone